MIDRFGQASRPEADRWSSGGPAEERHGISLSQLLAMALESGTCNLRGVMPNSPPNSLDLRTCQHFFPGLAAGMRSRPLEQRRKDLEFRVPIPRDATESGACGLVAA